MGKYTVLDYPAADQAVQDVLDMVVEGVLNLMGEHVQAIILIGSYGRGEGGVYQKEGDFLLVNDLDIAVFVRGGFKRIKQRFNTQLKQLANDLQPKANGLKQIDIDLTNTRRFRIVPNMVSYYEIKHGNKVLYGNINLKSLMPSLRADDLSSFDGLNYFYTRGSGLLISAIILQKQYFDKKTKHYFQIELQKACLAMGDALLLYKKKYHFSYMERFRIFQNLDLVNSTSDICPDLIKRVATLYKWGMKQKLTPTIENYSENEMIEHWFEVRDTFCDFFLWYESRRLMKKFISWANYTEHIKINGLSPPWGYQVREVLKNILASKKLTIETKIEKLLPKMIILLFGIEKNSNKYNDNILKTLHREMKFSYNFLDNHDYAFYINKYLEKFHPTGFAAHLIKK